LTVASGLLVSLGVVWIITTVSPRYFRWANAPLVSSFSPVPWLLWLHETTEYTEWKYQNIPNCFSMKFKSSDESAFKTKQIIEINSVEMCWFFMSWFRWILLRSLDRETKINFLTLACEMVENNGESFLPSYILVKYVFHFQGQCVSRLSLYSSSLTNFYEFLTLKFLYMKRRFKKKRSNPDEIDEQTTGSFQRAFFIRRPSFV
jgi:hypothetical protein